MASQNSKQTISGGRISDESLFAGLKVLDIASFIAGPAATTVLSDFGAEVIKVEKPGTGDPYRQDYLRPPNPASKENYAWQLDNRNKRSLVVDLKNPHATEVLARLVKWADVLVTNFPPRVRQRLKLSYEDISTLNPRLIYADITGYGELGPEADKPGFDITAYWARTGLMQFMHDASSPPVAPVPGSGDHATAMSLYAGIVSGLYRRERTGRGCQVQTSLIANGVWAASMWLQAALQGAKFSDPIDRHHMPNALFASYQRRPLWPSWTECSADTHSRIGSEFLMPLSCRIAWCKLGKNSSTIRNFSPTISSFPSRMVKTVAN